MKKVSVKISQPNESLIFPNQCVICDKPTVGNLDLTFQDGINRKIYYCSEHHPIAQEFHNATYFIDREFDKQPGCLGLMIAASGGIVYLVVQIVSNLLNLNIKIDGFVGILILIAAIPVYLFIKSRVSVWGKNNILKNLEKNNPKINFNDTEGDRIAVGIGLTRVGEGSEKQYHFSFIDDSFAQAFERLNQKTLV